MGVDGEDLSLDGRGLASDLLLKLCIAHDLGISVRTVELHRTRMLERLGVRHLAQAIRIAVIATLP